MSSFSLQLNKLMAAYKDRVDETVSKVVRGVVIKIDARSPVGDPTNWKHPAPAGYVGGRFRANNQLGLDKIPAGTLDKVDPSGRGTVAMNFGRIPKQAAGHTYHIANNLPYAQRIEFGWSTQSPTGVYGVTALELQKFVDEAVASAKASTR